MSELLLGDEAVALAALHSGIGGAFSYPGTPATEIFEFIQEHAPPEVQARWSANEKVAYEEALGMSFAGRRALVSMKHVGLNVAADPFMSSALTGAHGGFVLAVADDPSMHSSQNEQDSRFYAQFAKIPLFEPGNQQEAYDMTRQAFEMSEHLRIPVMVRMVTRLAHSRSLVRTSPPVQPNPLGKAADWRKWTLLPVNARERYRHLLDLQTALQDHALYSPFNSLTLHGSRGIIACGLAYNYVREVLQQDTADSILKIGAYPVPAAMVRELVDHCREIVVFEEGSPFLETQIRGLLGLPDKLIRGRCTGSVPPDGELNTDRVQQALGLPVEVQPEQSAPIPPRPPRLCDGCPHCDTYTALLDATQDCGEPYYFGDIGCYSLAALPPYRAMDACVDMGASIGMGHGAAQAGAHPVICTIGDSTFVHSGIPALLGAIRADANMTVIILDNATVAMTGAQDVLVSGEALIRLIEGLGVPPERLVRLNPLPSKRAENTDLLRQAIDHRGLSVVVACRPCLHVKRKTPVQERVHLA